MIFIKCFKNSILLPRPNRTSKRPSYLFSLIADIFPTLMTVLYGKGQLPRCKRTPLFIKSLLSAFLLKRRKKVLIFWISFFCIKLRVLNRHWVFLLHFLTGSSKGREIRVKLLNCPISKISNENKWFSSFFFLIWFSPLHLFFACKLLFCTILFDWHFSAPPATVTEIILHNGFKGDFGSYFFVCVFLCLLKQW